MSTRTPNLGLVKPELNDPADITAMNENWDKIEEEFNKPQTLFTYGTTDLTAGESPLETGKLYFVYE